MSHYSITTYFNDLENAIHYGGSTRETAIRLAFQKLWGKYDDDEGLHLIGAALLTEFLLLFGYNSANEEIGNISDRGLQQFQNRYQLNESSSPVCYAASSELREDFNIGATAKGEITKEDIFYYTYAVLHDPAYRKKYEMNLKSEFPLPFYDNFSQWRNWGKKLMDLHINYETAEPYLLQRKEVNTKAEPRAKLKAIKETGVIELDENTELHGIPEEAWEYKPANRSALEWILDQYKEKKRKDQTKAEKFNSYKFADYKEKVVDLLERVCRVSVETMEVVREMEETDLPGFRNLEGLDD